MSSQEQQPKTDPPAYLRLHPERKPYQMRAKTRRAVEAIGTKGVSVAEAAKIAGMSVSALYRALARPEIEQELERIKALQVSRIDDLSAQAKAAAIANGLELMNSAEDEKVRARMVEFFAGGGKSGLTVNVQNNVNSGGYAYAPPGSKVVDVVDAEKADDGGDA